MSYHLIIQFSDFENQFYIISVLILLKINVTYKLNDITFCPPRNLFTFPTKRSIYQNVQRTSITN